MNMEANGDRILKVITHFCESNADFADKVGVSRQVVGNWINRDNGKKVLDKILTTFPSVNPGWLFTGEGDMLKSSPVVVEAVSASADKKGDFLIENNNGVKFYDLGNGRYRMTVSKVPFCAYGRFANESDRLDPDKEDWESESFEWDRIVHGRYLAFEVKGDSMDNGTRESFEEGDVVLVRELDRSHWRDGLRYKDHPYWVVVFGTSVLIKQMTGCDMDEGKITLHSLNPSPEFSDFSLPLDSVRALYYVLQKKPKVVRF